MHHSEGERSKGRVLLHHLRVEGSTGTVPVSLKGGNPLMKEMLRGLLVDPWWVIPDEMSVVLETELEREISADHILHGKKSLAVARRMDRDDVVFWLDELEKFAVVHLTYAKETSKDFPRTELFSLHELIKYCKGVSKYY